MSTEQKPPIDITPKTGPKAGPLDPANPRPNQTQQKGGGGSTNWMPTIVAIVVSVVISAAMVFLFNPTKSGLDTLSSQVVELDNRVAPLEAQISNVGTIQSRLDTFLSNSVNYITQDALTGITDGMASDAELATLQSSVDSLTNENSVLASRITELEIVEEEEEGTSSSSTSSPEDVRWDFRTPSLLSFTAGTGAYDIITNPTGDDFSTEAPKLKVEHFRIDESGSYEFYLQVRNSDDLLPSKADGSVSIELTLSSDRGDALLNDSSTYIYTDEMPSDWFEVSWIDWDDGDFTTVTKGSVDITRRVDFETENFGIPSLDPGESVELDLVLELYYE